jgi:DNA-binding NarL/FixJ family response regulator
VIRILLVDDHALFRQPLAFMLEREPDMTVTGQAGTLAEARQAIQSAGSVDVAIVDLGLPDGDGVELIRDLRALNPHALVLVVTAQADRQRWAEALEAGAAGVLHKSASLDQIVDAIRRLHAGEHLLSPGELLELLRLAGERRARDLEARAALGRLTPRERDVLQALAEGLSDKEIAQRLHISVETVRTHMVNILGKLGVESRLQALVVALRHGFVTIE